MVLVFFQVEKYIFQSIIIIFFYSICYTHMIDNNCLDISVSLCLSII